MKCGTKKERDGEREKGKIKVNECEERDKTTIKCIRNHERACVHMHTCSYIAHTDASTSTHTYQSVSKRRPRIYSHTVTQRHIY